jgi:hypothetical protein
LIEFSKTHSEYMAPFETGGEERIEEWFKNRSAFLETIDTDSGVCFDITVENNFFMPYCIFNSILKGESTKLIDHYSKESEDLGWQWGFLFYDFAVTVKSGDATGCDKLDYNTGISPNLKAWHSQTGIPSNIGDFRLLCKAVVLKDAALCDSIEFRKFRELCMPLINNDEALCDKRYFCYSIMRMVGEI